MFPCYCRSMDTVDASSIIEDNLEESLVSSFVLNDRKRAESSSLRFPKSIDESPPPPPPPPLGGVIQGIRTSSGGGMFSPSQGPEMLTTKLTHPD